VFAVAVLAASGARAAAQDRITRIDAGAQVSAIAFAFTGSSSFREETLRGVLRTTEQGSAVGLRRTLSFLPLVPAVGEHSFSPVELQKDVVRLRHFYRESGFLEAAVDYATEYDRAENLVTVTFTIEEGPPSSIRSVRAVTPDSAAVALPADLERDWEDFLADNAPRTGARIARGDPARFAAAIASWLRDRGYPNARASASVIEDLPARALDVIATVHTDERRRIGEFTVAGETSLDDDVLLREIPLAPGDWYSASALQDGRQELMGLGVFRQVRFRLDSTGSGTGDLPITITAVEGDLKTITGDIGFDSRGGLTARTQWQHRNFPGDARTFSVSGLAQTGLLSFQSTPEILYRGSLALGQPYIFSRKVSLVLEPYAEYRDDQRDKSTAVGANLSLIWRSSPTATLTLRYAISGRQVEEYRYGDFSSGKSDLLQILSQAALGAYVRSSTFSVLPLYARLDDLADPASGFALRPDLRVTVPGSMNSVEYFRADIVANGYLPLGRTVGVKLRASAGRLFPIGESRLVAGVDTLIQYLQLRDVAFTAGGPEDVRGWESRLLGPKFPDYRVDFGGEDTVVYADNFIPVGGLARVSFSLELRLPFPWLGEAWRTVVFLDGGKVWTPTGGLYRGQDPYGQESMYYATGGGVDFRTPVGAIRASLGYKLNPSFLDLREASDIQAADEAGIPLEQVPAKPSLRWQFNLSLGVAF
jgi:outer membrane protein insertion porin family